MIISILNGLNRTSVGLKPLAQTRFSLPRIPPQSNQRGIETLLGEDLPAEVLDASIEPAWD